MAQPFDSAAWRNEGKRLADELRAAYRSVAGEEGPTEEEVAQAVRTLGAALARVATALETAGRNERVRRHLDNATTSLAEAASTFLTEVVPAAEGSRRSEDGSG